MAIYDITNDLNQIDFGATGDAEVLQNVRMILATPQFSCPLDRDFGWDPNVDAPINLVQAKLTARIVAAIRRYEPRAQVVQVTFQGDGQQGVLKPIVKVRIDDDTV
jgi:hypothetical protein